MEVLWFFIMIALLLKYLEPAEAKQQRKERAKKQQLQDNTKLHTLNGDMKSLWQLIKDAIIYIFVIIFGIAVWVGIPWAIASGVIAFKDRGKAVVYYLYDNKPQIPGIYYISKDEKSIIQNTTGTLIQYKECSIIDIENWKCKYNFIGDNITISMSNGKLDEGIAWEKNYEQISPIYYYFRKFTQLINATFFKNAKDLS